MNPETFDVPILTLTGIDDSTSLATISSLLRLRSCELGILYSASRHDDDGCVNHKYPPRDSIARLLSDHRKLMSDRYAIHICGSLARQQLLQKELNDIIPRDDIRIQVNGIVSVEELKEICKLYPNQPIITQHFTGNEVLVEVDCENHSILVDSSRGNGICPIEWVRPPTTKPVGFAGGLGPHNVLDLLPKFDGLSLDVKEEVILPYWIDMESSLREYFVCSDFDNGDNVVFSAEKCFETQLRYIEATSILGYEFFDLWNDMS